MKQRITTAMIMAIIFIPLVWFGNRFYLFAISCGILSMLGAWEFRKMLQKKNPLPIWIDIIAVLLTAGLYTLGILAFYNVIPAVGILYYCAFVLIALLGMMVFVSDFQTKDVGGVGMTMLYPGLGFLALAILRHLGLILLIYVLLVVIVTDTFAYFLGIRFGKHKLCPSISPKKSVEGAVSGLVIGGALSALFAIFTDLFNLHFSVVILLSFVLSVIAQIGDLVASKMKRNAEIKDFSNLFPGHGGVLDRFDSWMFTAMFLLLFVRVVALIVGHPVV